MAESKQAKNAEGEIRSMVEKWVESVRQKDLDGVMAHYAPNVITFDIVPPLASAGADNYRKNWAMWFESIEGPIDYEMRDLQITASDDIAFCHSVNRVSSVSKQAGREETWLRATVGFKKVNGEWLVTHEHVSLPFYMETGKAAVDLEP
jgi:uncharacterized protein (TIGR02246 family)